MHLHPHLSLKVQLHLSAQVPDRTFWKRSGLSLIPCMSIALARGDWPYCSSHTISQGLFHHHPVSDRHITLMTQTRAGNKLSQTLYVCGELYLNTHCCGGGQGEKLALCIKTRHLCLLLFSVCIPSPHSSISLTSSHGSRENNGGPPASTPLFSKVRSRHTSFE